MAATVLQVRPGCAQALAAMALLDAAGECFELRTDGAGAPVLTRATLRLRGFPAIARRALPHTPLYAGTPAQRAAADQWLDAVYADVRPLVAALWTPDGAAAADELCAYLAELQGALAHDRFLAGSEPCAADLALLFETLPALRLMLGAERLARLPRFLAYARALAALPALRPLVGELRPAPLPLRLPPPLPPVPAPKPAARPAEEEAPRKEYVFPPSQFNFFDFKTLYVNAPRKQDALDFLWQHWDASAFSFWRLEYDKLPTECKVLFLTNNLMGGFLGRAEACRKFVLGVQGVFGQEPDLHVRGVWLWRGTAMLPPLQDHEQFDVYKFRQLDPLSPPDRALIEHYWTAAEGDSVEGLTLQTLKYLK